MRTKAEAKAKRKRTPGKTPAERVQSDGGGWTGSKTGGRQLPEGWTGRKVAAP